MARPRAQPASNDDDYHPPRRSSRNRQPSRRPDEPVTFVVPTREEDEMDTSDSDQSSSHPFPSPAQLIGRQSRDNSVEILEGPQHTQTVVDGLRSDNGEEAAAVAVGFEDQGNRPISPELGSTPPASTPTAMAQRLAEMRFMMRVDAPNLTYHERVTMLIAEIHRLEGNDSLAQVTPSAGGSAEIQENIGLALPVDEDWDNHIPAFGEPDESGEALYFIGLQTPQSGREFVEVIVTSPPDHTLIERLSTGLLGRQLGRIQDRSAYYIGTAEAPVPVSANYMHHSCTFRELGPWLQVQSAEDVSLAGLEPVPTSQARSTLLAGRRLSDSVPVYTLYIYHEDTDTSRNAPLDVGMPTASSANAPLSTALANTIAAPGPVPVDNVAQYLRDRFASRLDRIVHVQNLACGTGYRHCTQEKHVTSICTSLGLQLVSRVYAPIHVEGGLAITYDDVVRAAGLNASTFAAARGHVRRARQACMRLARYVSANEGEADENWMRWYRVFDALLGESDIGDEHLSDSTGSARAEAISLGYEELKRKTVDILQNLP